MNKLNKWYKHDQNSALSPRFSHSLITYKDYLIIFGGQNPSGLLSDLLFFNTKKLYWKKVSCKGKKPAARSAHTAVLYKDSMYIYGGITSEKPVTNATLFGLNLQEYFWEEYKKGPARFSHTSVIWKDNMIVFGGLDLDFCECNEVMIYSFVNNNWSEWKTKGDIPKKRYAHCAFIHNSSMFICFGMDNENNCFNDMFELDLEKLYWKSVKLIDPPSPKAFSSCCKFNDEIFLFGGLIFLGNESHACDNDFFRFDCTSHKFYKIKTKRGPSKRASTCLSSTTNSIFLFGGRHEDLYWDELWEYTLSIEKPKLYEHLGKNSFVDVIFFYK